jgi:DNA helicase-2/ATP-dependent DNA helicase PcrA
MTTTTRNAPTVNPQQCDAIITTDGPLLIITGPGSGKTFILFEWVVYLITERGATSEQLFVIAFTDNAAQELSLLKSFTNK